MFWIGLIAGILLFPLIIPTTIVVFEGFLFAVCYIFAMIRGSIRILGYWATLKATIRPKMLWWAFKLPWSRAFGVYRHVYGIPFTNGDHWQYYFRYTKAEESIDVPSPANEK